MIGVFAFYQKILRVFNVHQGGIFKPSTYIELVDDAQMEYFNELVEEFQKTQVISDKLTPFLDSANIVITSKSGHPWDLVVKPPMYEYFASARIIKKSGSACLCKDLGTFNENGKEIKTVDESKCKYIDPDEIAELRLENDKENCEVPIRLVDNDRWGSIYNHKRKGPSCDKPIITQFSGGYKIAPKSCSNAIIMDFFRRPIKPVFNFTVINPGLENEYIQFNPIGSVNLEWSETVIEPLMLKIQKKYAIFTGQDNLFAQVQSEKK